MSTPPTWPPPPPLPPDAAGGPAPNATSYAPPAQAKTSPGVPLVLILVLVVVGGLFVIGIVAAVALPAMLRARAGVHERVALETVQRVGRAEAAWATAHEGQFAEMACLAEPSSCGDPHTVPRGPSAMDLALFGQQTGYAFGFVRRPADEDRATSGNPGVSPAGEPSDADVRAQLEQFSTPDTGATPEPTPRPTESSDVPADRGGFAFWAAPRAATGIRPFCVDETAVIRVYALDAAWTPPSADRPRCAETGRPLQRDSP